MGPPSPAIGGTTQSRTRWDDTSSGQVARQTLPNVRLLARFASSQEEDLKIYARAPICLTVLFGKPKSLSERFVRHARHVLAGLCEECPRSNKLTQLAEFLQRKNYNTILVHRALTLPSLAIGPSLDSHSGRLEALAVPGAVFQRNHLGNSRATLQHLEHVVYNSLVLVSIATTNSCLQDDHRSWLADHD